MSIPCTFFSPDPANKSVGKTSLQDADPTLLAICPAAPKDNSASFDRVLDDVDEKPADSNAKESDDARAPTSTSGSLTSDQLALMMSMIMPSPAPLPPPVAPPIQPDGADSSSSLELLGAEGRSIPELLVRGADVLEYQVAPMPADNAAAASLESSPGRSALPADPKTLPLPAGESSPQGAPALSNAGPQARSVSSASMRAMPQPQVQSKLRTETASAAVSAQRLLTPSEAATGQPVDGDPSRSGLGGIPLFRSAGMLGVRPLRLRDMSRDVTTPVQPASLAQVADSTPDGPVATPAAPATSPAAGSLPLSVSTASMPTAGGGDVSSDDPRNSTSDTPSTPAASAAPATASETPTSALTAAAAQNASANLPRPRVGTSDRPEKTAGSPSSIRSPGGKSSTARGKNVALPADGEGVDKSSNEVGTVAANWGKTMYQETRNFPPASSPSDFSSLGSLQRSDQGTTAEDLKQVTPAHATDLVHEIREIADGLWAVERNSVEVKFNFSEQERLSVRVEYRNGTVQATFRTDSSDVRDAIAREWQAQGGLGDQRPYRVADPVFTTATTQPSSGFSFGSDNSRQQRSPEQQPQPMPFDRLALGSISRSAPSLTSSSLASSPSSRETTGRLHALV